MEFKVLKISIPTQIAQKQKVGLRALASTSSKIYPKQSNPENPKTEAVIDENICTVI